MPVFAAAVFTMLISVPPPAYQPVVIEGPQLFCGESFSIRLHEGESVSTPWQGQIRQAGHIAYYSAETKAGRINIYESPADRTVDGAKEELYIPGGRFQFVHQGSYDDGNNTHSQVGFQTSDHEAVGRVLFDFIAPKRNSELENEVLKSVGRPPVDASVCGAVG